MRPTTLMSLCAAILSGLISPHAASAENSPAIQKFISRAVELTEQDGGFIYDIPPKVDERGSSKRLAKHFVSQRTQTGPLIVYSTDPAVAARVARMAFASSRPASLRGLTVICLVGRRYDSYLRSTAAISGAKLQVKPFPR